MNIVNMFSRRRVIIIALVLITIIGAVFLLVPKNDNTPVKTQVQPGETITSEQVDQVNQNNTNTQPSTNPQAAPTQDNFYSLITQSKGVAPDASGHVSFGILKTQNPLTGWYIVTIKSGNLEPAKVIFHQTNDPNNPLAIVAGPGTYFPDSISLPTAVRKAL